jgi:anti-sigma factor RsiW
MTDNLNNPNLSNEDRANLVAYLDGELDEKASLALEAKLGIDPHARTEVEQLKRTWDLLDHLPKPAPSSRFTHRTMERLAIQTAPTRMSARLSPRWRPSSMLVGVAASALVASGVGFMGARWLSPPRQTPVQVSGGEIDPEALLRDRRVIENRRLYEQVVSFDFLRELSNPDDPDLFGDDGSGS